MEMGQFAKQTLGFQKTAFNHTIDLFVSMQEQAEKVTSSWADKNGLMPAQNWKIMTQLCQACKQGLVEYQKFINEAMDNMGNFMVMAPASKQAAPASPKADEKPAVKKEAKKGPEPEKEK
jgi:hypothetical protein